MWQEWRHPADILKALMSLSKTKSNYRCDSFQGCFDDREQNQKFLCHPEAAMNSTHVRNKC